MPEIIVDFLAQKMAPIMFASLVVILLLGYPAAFSLAAIGLIFGLSGIYVTHQFVPDFLQALPERIFGIMNNDVLLAIPFFTFMGLILGRSVGDMYEGAFLPGLMLAALYASYVFLVTIVFQQAAPGLPAEAVGYK